MKRMKKNTVVRNVAIGVGVVVALAGFAGVNLRATIADNQVSVAKKAGANDAEKKDVLENYSFTSDAAGVGVAGSMTDYSSELKSIKLQAAANNGAITVDLDDGYYSQIMLDVDGISNNAYLMSYNAANYPLMVTLSWICSKQTSLSSESYHYCAIKAEHGNSVYALYKVSVGSAATSGRSALYARSNGQWFGDMAAPDNNDNSASGIHLYRYGYSLNDVYYTAFTNLSHTGYTNITKFGEGVYSFVSDSRINPVKTFSSVYDGNYNRGNDSTTLYVDLITLPDQIFAGVMSCCGYIYGLTKV